MTRGAAVIDVRDLVVRRGRVLALDGVSFATRPGAVTGLLGPSGCGKSTLMRAVVGVQVVTSGTVEVLGLPAGDRRLRDRVGYVTQASSVYDDLTVTENLRFFARVLGVPGGEVDRCIDAVDLRPRPGPGGQPALRGPAVPGLARRRAARHARAAGPRRADRRAGPGAAARPVGDVPRLADAGTAVLVSSHVMDEAERCDRLLLMREGRLLADDTLDGLLARTGTTDVEAAFLALVEGPAA